jgi:cell wall-associated protease
MKNGRPHAVAMTAVAAITAAVLTGIPAAAATAGTTGPAERETVMFHALSAPADPLYAYQWGMQPSATVAGSGNWLPAYESGATGAGVTVAVVDTGVTGGNELPNVVAGWNVLANNAYAADDNGHGTHVAGTIAQATNNGVGPAGVASGARILPVKVLDANGDGADTAIITGINWAVAHGADVINLSLGGTGDGGTCAAVANAVASGVAVVAASGNAGGPVSYPAACPGAIAVGATTLGGSIASYSNRGPQLAVVAPGGDNTVDTNRDGYPDGILQWSVFGGSPGYYFESGTSMASPFVAGVAALILEQWRGAAPSDVRGVLTATARDRGVAGRDDIYGAGIVDAAAAVSRARQLAATPTSAGPSSSPTSPTTTAPTSTTPTGDMAPVVRLAGVTRYGTSAAISGAGWPTSASTVYLTSGNGFADALATGALSGRKNGPLLLADRCALPSDTVDALGRLHPSEVVVVGGSAAVCDTVAEQARALTGATVTRVAGTDRYATSAELSRLGWPNGSAVAYLASATNFADALGGAAQAARADAPLLLTDGTTLSAAVRQELTRLGATEIRVLGGRTAVSDALVASLAGASRIAGADRYATATSGALRGWADGAGTVYLASGTTFPDGLAVGPLAARDGSPLLLVPPCELPATVADALRTLKPTKLVVVGGANAVCDTLLAKMGAAAAAQ